MQHAADFPGPLPLHGLQRIPGSVPAVDNHGKFLLPGHVQLAFQPVNLGFMVFLVPIVIQTDFSHRQNLLPPAQIPHPLHGLLVQGTHIVRMNPHRAVYKRIFFRQRHGPVPAGHFRAYIDDRSDTCVSQRIQQFLPILVKGLVVIMRMRLKNHDFLTFRLSILPNVSADLRAGGHLLLRGHQGKISLRVLRAQQHAFRQHAGQLRGL